VKRILIAGGGTGGHLMPGLALAEALQRESADVEPVLVGASRGVEARVLPTREFRYYLLPVEPIYRRAWWKNARWPFLLARLLRAGRRVLNAEDPVVAVGTGGYAAGPILVQAMRRRLPVVLQEQNAFPGVTTRWLARRARQVHLGFPEARVYLRPGPRTEICQYGNPITPPPVPRPEAMVARERLGVPQGSRVVFVMGGSQGARSINRVVARAVDSGGLDRIHLLWGTGAGMWEEYRHYDKQPTRIVRSFWDPISDAYAAADVVVGRAGAMTTAELCAWAMPSVLIPLPTSAGGHQNRNAEALARSGAATHLPEPALTPATLCEELARLLDHPARLRAMGQAAGARGQPHAAQSIARHILGLVG
jgi:UDP-N-acetylglucosamine--N-acetylmuramyl-(pentapeptide) pyrophosphoryl-undecaprenol N-acetylglucosamine transferase